MPYTYSATAELHLLDNIGTYEVPTMIVDWGDLGLEVYATLPFDYIMIAKTLIPGRSIEKALRIHVDPGFLESQNTASREVYATIVEVVAH